MCLSWGSLIFSEITLICKLVMQMSQHHQSLFATNRGVVQDIELNFGIDSSIEAINHTKTFDAVVFDVLRVPSDDIANQITLIDLPLFQRITPDELNCCAWTTKKKHELCPNVVNFTKRFNQVSFWVSSEILASNTAKIRAEKVIHFIRISKRLLELNSLNSLKAIVCGLHSAPIYRLTKTWNLVPKRDKEKLEKLTELVSEDNNCSKIRSYLDVARLPCIPYLGMYLTDLTYINTIHPCTGGLDLERSIKVNDILRIIADYQQSQYDLPAISHIQIYLSSVKYIDELQKFLEDDNYKLSLQVEPRVRPLNEKINRETKSVSEFASDSDGLFPTTQRSTPIKTSSLRSPSRLAPKHSSLHLPGPFRSPSPDKKRYMPNHRKVKSLGSQQQFNSNIRLHNSTSSSLSPSSTSGSHFCLVDDSLVDDQQLEISSSNSYDSGLDHDEPETHPIIQNVELKKDNVSPLNPWTYFKLQGFLKRKTLLKNGIRPMVSSWQRYWVGITYTPTASMVYFLPKYRGFGGHDRIHFRNEPHKILPLEGCTVFTCSDADTFQLTEESGDNVYRFRSGSQINGNLWYEAVREAADGGRSNVPKNLITFDDDDNDAFS